MTSSLTPGWTHAKTLDDPTIRIMRSRAVTHQAVDAVANIYTDMAGRLQPLFDLRKLDGFIVYLTNGEPWSELRLLEPIGTMRGDAENAYGVPESDDKRGGATARFLWLDEQLICRTGVETRNQAFAAGKRAERDDEVRTFDQVIHEFAHSIQMIYGFNGRIESSYTDSKLDPDPYEAFAKAAQRYFGCPAGPLTWDEDICLVHTFSAPNLPAYSVPDARPIGGQRGGITGTGGSWRPPRGSTPSSGTANAGRIAAASKPTPNRIPPASRQTPTRIPPGR